MFVMSDILNSSRRFVPFQCLYDQLHGALSSLQIQNMKSVEHEDSEMNNDYSVDPLADPRLDKMDLFNMVDTEDRDKIMSAQTSFDTGDGEFVSTSSAASSANVETAPVSGSGE